MTTNGQRPQHRRWTGALTIAAAAVLIVPAVLAAHAVVYPRASTIGAYERYTLRVPNEKDGPTTRIEIRFPAGLRVSSFADVAGWTLQPLTDSAGAIIGAVWTGTLLPKRFVELPFVAVNPKTPTTLSWPVIQTYAGNVRVDWTGAAGSKSPASSTAVADTATQVTNTGDHTSRWVAWTALAVAFVALGFALRQPKHG